MANTEYAGNLTRPHWGGPNSDTDIHMEVFEGALDTSFMYNAFFRSNSTFIPVQDRSNTARIDRLGTVQVRGRKSGEALESQSVKNDKLVVTVDTTTYARTPVDYQDDWTAPDYLPAIGANHGTEHAKLYDQSHIIQLIKSRNWIAPAHLKPAFHDGISKSAQLVAGDTEASAQALIAAHLEAVTELIRRDLGGSLSEFITLVDPSVFNLLLQSSKLLSVDYSAGNGDYAQRRVAFLNGVRLVETARFPQAVASDHPLGASFNVDAEDIQCQMVIYHPKMSLVTVEAKPHTVTKWDDPQNFANVLDSYAMYTVGQRRPDTVAVIRVIPAA